MLVQHVLKLLLGLALKSDELQAIPVILLPSDNSERDNDRGAGAGKLNMQREMGADGKLHIGFEFAPAYGKICYQPRP